MVVPAVLVSIIAVSTALPTEQIDLVISKLGGEDRFQYMQDATGTTHLVDTWLKFSDLKRAVRYKPDVENVYHLFTRTNPTVSQTLLFGDMNLLTTSNFNPARRTIVFLHGWIDTVTGKSNRVLVPAFLAAEDVNMISVDWSAGGGTINYITAVVNTVPSGQSVARFINWLNQVTGSTPDQYHVLGHSLGGQQCGIVGRNVNGDIAYITALDPAFPGWTKNEQRLRPTDGAYTEVIHTNAGILGYLTSLGHADFYPNGGIGMPGCFLPSCHHDRSYYYMAESLISGGFTGIRCGTRLGALTGTCLLQGTLQMGGLRPKTGSSGLFYLKTNAGPPYSKG